MDKKMTMYEIASMPKIIEDLMNEALTDPDTGEVRELTDEENSSFLEWLEEFEESFETKFNNICKVSRNIKAQAALAEAEKSILNKEIESWRRKQQARENEEKRVKLLITLAFDKLGIKKHKTALFNAYFQKTAKSAKPSTTFNPDKVPVEYLKRELNTAAINEAIQEGRLYEKGNTESEMFNEHKLFYKDKNGEERVLEGVTYSGGETLVIR